MKTLLAKALKKAFRIPADVRFRHELKQVLRPSVNALIGVAGNTLRYIPYPTKQGRYLLERLNRDNHQYLAMSLPVPPPGVRIAYGDTEEIWLSGGKKNVDTMMTLLTSTNFTIQKGSRILDLGCASGRMIRWLADLAEECEIWGVDIDARLIVWCQENLTPPFNFATVTTMPHLPFEDRYFDLIYCGSVFTHIDDLADAWLLEIKRIMRPGGRVFITVGDKHSVDLIMNDPDYHVLRSLFLLHDKERNWRNGNYYKCSMLPGDENCHVFYDVEYLRQHWGRVLKIISVAPEAYFFQTAVLMEKY